MIKIVIHIVSIILFLIGMIIIHVVENAITFIMVGNEVQFFYVENFDFFMISLPRMFVLDMGILLCGIAFFTEFYLTFKPIRIKNDI